MPMIPGRASIPLPSSRAYESSSVHIGMVTASNEKCCSTIRSHEVDSVVGIEAEGQVMEGHRMASPSTEAALHVSSCAQTPFLCPRFIAPPHW
jgi:hypothetical protein